MKMKAILFSCLCGTLLLSSCNSDDPGNDELSFVDIVTIESTGNVGSVVTLQKMGDSPLVTLTTPQQFDQAVFKPDTRVLIYYHPQSNEQYVSGPITIHSASPTYGEGKKPEVKTSAETNKWATGKVGLMAVWRTGKYLNMQFQATTAGEPRQVEMVADAMTLDSEVPHLHFIYEGTNGAQPQTYTFYGSWNIEEIWNKSGVKGVRIYVADTNNITGVADYIEIKKIDKEEFQPSTPVQ